MARIRLRNCIVRLMDGFRATAAVAANGADGETTLSINSFVSTLAAWALGTRFEIAGVDQIYTVTAVTLGPATGAVNTAAAADTDTDLDVDTITGRVPVGTVFTIAGVNETYTVTATTETGSDTTNIEFTPALATAAGIPAEDAVITFVQKPAAVTFTPPLATADGIPSAADVITIQGRACEIKIGDGNLTWDEVTNYEYEMDRGHIDSVAEGDDEPLSVSLDAVYEFVRAVAGSGTPTAEDIMKQRGEASDWITSGADACELYSIDIEIDHTPPCSAEHEITTFREFRYESVGHDFGGASLAFSGRCKVTEPEVIRRAY